MPRKSKKSLSLGEKIARIRKAGLGEGILLQAGSPPDWGPDLSLNQRIQAVLDLLKEAHKKPTHQMLAFIAYDIEDNRVRRLIAKYLIEQGCVRVQKSVYFLETQPARYKDMVQTLREVQAMYDNEDSIFFLPIGLDQVNRMEMIGRNLHVEMAIDQPNTLFI